MTTRRRTRVDLHSHTARSDGILEPLELYARMRAAGMAVVAITDHDSLEAIRELRAAGLGEVASAGDPLLVAGVEINTVADAEMTALIESGPWIGELHVLGLGVDPYDPTLEAALAAQRQGRRERLERMLGVLAAQGMDVRAYVPAARDRASLAAAGSLGRPHVARALVAAGFAVSVDDAFARLLERGCPGWVPRAGMGARDAIAAITAAGGIAALAHAPGAPRAPDLMERLIAWGLGGLETHHRSFDEATTSEMSALADELTLLPTGGSDYHGDDMDYATALATTFVPDGLGERLLTALSR